MIKIADIPEDQLLFYDIETDSQFAPYCELKMIGVQEGLKGKPYLVEDWGQRKRFREKLASRDVIKVMFNGINFDDQVLWRNGFPVNEENRHDLFLIAKTVAPRLPAYSLKFINWYYFGDFHQPEMDLNEWLRKNGLDHKSMYAAPKTLLKPYCLYDVHPQTTNLFRLFWEVVQRPLHWQAYTEVELPMGIVMEEIMLRGGEYLDERLIDEKIATLQNDKLGWEDHVWTLTGGKISNPNSVKQVGAYLQDEESIELELTEAGNFSLKKTDLLDFLDLDNPNQDRSRIIRALYEVRKINNTLSYYRNYKDALAHCADHSKRGWIPKQYSLSGARTRRILSNSKYKLNFQNPNHAAKEVQIVPDGWLGGWIDATQIENVVHIYESKDQERRADYEANEEWNEYVWLCNKILNTHQTKDELDDLSINAFPSNPMWSVYKGYKTIKLSINFGMGVVKYCKMRRLPEQAGRREFMRVMLACPAIKKLQRDVADKLQTVGYVQDVFGHIYSGNVRLAYKVMAYLIQGCGTGSLPKVQMRCNYDALHQWDHKILPHERKTNWLDTVVVDKPRDIMSFGVMTGTTHDENSFRISLTLGTDKIVATLQQMMFNMTKRFSHKFDNIPLRAKLYLVRGPGKVNDRVEVNIKQLKKLRKLING